MRAVAVALVALALTLALGGTPASGTPASGHAVDRPAAPVAGAHPEPLATKKPKPKKTPKPSPSPSVSQSPTPAPAPTRRPVDEEGERWVQLAWVVGGGLLGSVLAFFAIGSLMRFTARRRAGR